jgi:hypothetical protein
MRRKLLNIRGPCRTTGSSQRRIKVQSVPSRTLASIRQRVPRGVIRAQASVCCARWHDKTTRHEEASCRPRFAPKHFISRPAHTTSIPTVPPRQTCSIRVYLPRANPLSTRRDVPRSNWSTCAGLQVRRVVLYIKAVISTYRSSTPRAVAALTLITPPYFSLDLVPEIEGTWLGPY